MVTIMEISVPSNQVKLVHKHYFYVLKNVQYSFISAGSKKSQFKKINKVFDSVPNQNCVLVTLVGFAHLTEVKN